MELILYLRIEVGTNAAVKINWNGSDFICLSSKLLLLCVCEEAESSEEVGVSEEEEEMNANLPSSEWRRMHRSLLPSLLLVCSFSDAQSSATMPISPFACPVAVWRRRERVEERETKQQQME